MLGSRAEAEDLVQETYLRWHRTERARVRNPQAWLVTAVTRLAIDRLRALRTEREAYDGPWLPEPLIRREPPSPERTVEREDDLSVAFLVLLERLGPEERALLLLRDVFDLDYRDVAEALGKSEAACRQAVHRARRRLATDRRRFEVSEEERIGILRRFDAAVAAQDEGALLALFAPDSEWTSDGGGKAHAARRVLRGPEWITRLVLGVTRKVYPPAVTRRLATINGEAGLLFELDGKILAAMSIATDGEHILAVYQMLNPDKLASASAVGAEAVTGTAPSPSTR